MNNREDEIILCVTRSWLQNSNYSQRDFAVKMLAPKLKLQEPESLDDWDKWQANLQKKVSRIMTGEQAFPLAYKWEWVGALPDEASVECKRRLAAAAGYMDKLPTLSGAETVSANTAEIHEAFADVIKVSTAAHDGIYDERDNKEDANNQIDALYVLIEKAHEEMKRVHAGTGAKGTLCDVDNINI